MLKSDTLMFGVFLKTKDNCPDCYAEASEWHWATAELFHVKKSEDTSVALPGFTGFVQSWKSPQGANTTTSSK